MLATPLVICSPLDSNLLKKSSADTASPLSLGHQQALDQAVALNLAGLSYWQSLLHMELSRFSQSTSYVDDKKFFLSEQGYQNAEQELLATINAFFETPETQCRFPARKLFLASQLVIDFTDVDCTEYRQWRKTINTDSVVLVFASSYLNSPSSMYGHTFLRFDPPNVDSGSTLLSYALNFGANTNEDDNGFLYAYRGLAGGYPGLFAANPYYEKVKEYSRLENRDLWEYRLNLNEQEIDRMMAHIWELNLINFDYYFFDENCSFRLLELLDVARPGLYLTAHFPVVAIPVDTVKAVADAGLVDQVYYRSSNQTQLQQGIAKLDSQQQLQTLAFAGDAEQTPSGFDEVSVVRQGEVVSVAYDYLRYLHDDQQRDDAIAANSFNLLRRLAKYPIRQKANNVKSNRPVDPIKGHGSTLFAVTGGYQDEQWFGDVEWRIAYHDLLDPLDGYPTDTSLNMGRVVFRAQQGESLQLQRLDVLEINSLYPRDRFFKPLAWQVNMGFDRQHTKIKDQLVPQLNAGVGASFHGPFQGRLFSLLRARTEYNPSFERNVDIAGGVRFGYLRQYAVGSTVLQAEQLYFTGGVKRSAIEVGQSIHLAANVSLRFSFKRTINDSEGVNEASLAYRYYY